MTQSNRLSRDFWTFWTGQVISTLGSSFTMFAVPLLIYHLTHSPVNLALSMAASMLPYLLFGLVIGAWVDRLDRKVVMITVDVLLTLTVGSVPFMAAIGHLSVWWIYGSTFVASTLFIFFNSSEFAAIPSLVGQDDLVTANGRIQSSYYACMIAGPLLAGALSALVSVPNLLLIDACSYLVSAAALLSIRTRFNVDGPRRTSTIRRDIADGLSYVLRHPVLRNISAMMALYNFMSATVGAQEVLYAKERLHVTNAELGVFFAVAGGGSVLFSFFSGRFRKRWTFSRVALGSLTISGALLFVFALIPWFWIALPFWALQNGVASLFNIQTGSLRQAIVPNEMLGRVMSIAGVLAWSAIPLGSLAGGELIKLTGNVVLVYAGIGAVSCLIPLVFSFSALGHAEDYIPAAAATEAPAEAATV